MTPQLVWWLIVAFAAYTLCAILVMWGKLALEAAWARWRAR